MKMDDCSRGEEEEEEKQEVEEEAATETRRNQGPGGWRATTWRKQENLAGVTQ